VADAGPDRVAEAWGTDGTEVVLDGSLSFDPDDDALSFRWTDESGLVELGTGPTLTLTLPAGTYTFRLTVGDSRGGEDEDDVTITVEDTTPPHIRALTVSPDTLWPPNHQMVQVTVTATVEDAADPDPDCHIRSITVLDLGGGDGNTDPDHVITGPLTADLRAERSAQGPGRLYRIEVVAEDFTGNVSSPRELQVFVPHDRHDPNPFLPVPLPDPEPAMPETAEPPAPTDPEDPASPAPSEEAGKGKQADAGAVPAVPATPPVPPVPAEDEPQAADPAPASGEAPPEAAPPGGNGDDPEAAEEQGSGQESGGSAPGAPGNLGGGQGLGDPPENPADEKDENALDPVDPKKENGGLGDPKKLD
jgi:hypothetical protein